MKNILLIVSIFSTIALSAQAEQPCGEPRTDVAVEIDFSYLSTDGLSLTFCYVTEVGTSNRYEVLDCGFHRVGDVVTGEVDTYWTHKDAQGVPVCDYQRFVIRE